VLPDGTELSGLRKDGEYQSFHGEDLFTYIDGGAEVYFEYGFKGVIVQDYRRESAGRVSLEIFEMESAESAFGMFTFKCAPRGEVLDLGDGGQLADYYLNFWKGSYLVTITGLDPGSTLRGTLLDLARLVEKRLPGRGEHPLLVSLLPEEGRETQGLKFFKGPIALYNSYPFFREDVFAFERGIGAQYRTGASLYLFEYPDGRTAQARFEEAWAKFSAEPRYKNVRREGEGLSARDSRERRLLAARTKSYIIIALGDGDGRAAQELLAWAWKRLAADKEGR
jgi:hypothetical protein